MKLKEVNPKLMIVNAVTLASRYQQGRQAWVFIADLCGVGSTSAVEICKEIGLNPDKPISTTNAPKWGSQ